jgi:hypothetical protein
MTSVRVARRAAVAASSLALLAVLVAGGPVMAHESRSVAGFDVEVGLIGEPVYVGEPSGLDLHVSQGGAGVEGLESTLRAEVTFGEQHRELQLQPVATFPGGYESAFVPTAAGPYSFHLMGTIQGQPIDETFTSSPTGFDEVHEAAAMEFPFDLPTTAEVYATARKGEDASALVLPALLLGAGGLAAGVIAIGLALANRRTAA